MTKVSVVIPVGPEAHHAAYLSEALQSVAEQMRQPDEIIIVDDMHGLTWRGLLDIAHTGSLSMLGRTVRIWQAPWRLGVAAAFNAGIGLATGDLIFMLGADDKLLPECLEHCVKAFEKNDRKDAFYWVGVEYSDDRPDQFLPCNTAAVTKGLWRFTGGFPPEVGSGACDAALISVLMVHGPNLLVCVNGRKPLAWYRSHEQSDTASRAPWQGIILATRDLLTQSWAQPAWGRYE